jgi:hypothetical protein
MAVDEDLAAARLAEACDQVEERALAAARRPDDGPRLARGYLPREAVEHGRLLGIGERQLAHLHHRLAWPWPVGLC